MTDPCLSIQRGNTMRESGGLSCTGPSPSCPNAAEEVIRLHYLSGLSHGEIAAFLDIAPSTVLSHLHNGREQLRERLLPMVEETLSEERLPRGFGLKVLAALPLLPWSEAGAQASIAGLGLKRWLAGAGVAALGLLGWLSSDEIAEMIEIHSPRPRQALRVLLATPEQQATLDSALARGMIEDGRRGYGLVSISGDPDSAFLVTPEGESLALGKILQVVDLHHQARLAREMGMAILRGDTPRWPEIEARFSLIYGDTLILNDRSLMQGAVRRALNSADVYALLIQADERTPYEQIRRLQREALEAGIGLLILGLPPHVYARFDGTGTFGDGHARLPAATVYHPGCATSPRKREVDRSPLRPDPATFDRAKEEGGAGRRPARKHGIRG